MPITIQTPVGSATPDDLGRVLTAFKAEIEDQVNAQADTFSGVQAGGINTTNQGKAGDIIVGYNSTTGDLTVGVKAAAGSDKTYTLNKQTQQVATQTVPAKPSDSYIPLSTSNTTISTTDLPQNANFGWHLNTSTGFYSWGYNANGTIVYQNLRDFAGTISATQHGNQTVTTLHAAATSSGAGFMTITQVNQQTTNVANIATNTANIASNTSTITAQGTDINSINTVLTDITTTGTASHFLNCTHLDVNGTQVVGPRDTAWTLGGVATVIKNYSADAAAAAASSKASGDYLTVWNSIYTIVNTLAVHGLIG